MHSDHKTRMSLVISKHTNTLGGIHDDAHINVLTEHDCILIPPPAEIQGSRRKVEKTGGWHPRKSFFHACKESSL